MSETEDAEQVMESIPHVSFVPEGQSTSLAVIDAVAEVSGRPRLANESATEDAGNEPLEPLFEAIDPDALNTICPSWDEDAQTTTTVTFPYCGYDVTVESTGQITVTES